MGQVFDKFQGKQWRHRQVKVITDKVFDHFKNQFGTANLTFEDLYIAVLLIYNDINKHLPGPHFDPPSKEQVRTTMQTCDFNLDGELDREEFVKFIQYLTADALVVVSRGLILTLIVAPTVAVATKKATEGIPGVGKVVQRLPNSIYASLITLAALMFERSAHEFE
ncbi:uncharacterized protein LOC131160447 [Malania oleifera]|uniref:uncharacterized protein LOC131160447 n=1 Tax=Malania oleifera TaxID=397392 RepID=UPI0025AE0343|nr:uncharacterized protein LOC131160447 [Malania oleifera]XP_057972121.1 uncharacterized protein LOC131160447 [Malania oleifera]XP_057972122.1 uncharacterized protein LOC131160447 [Malania oleifera]XP_057972123.1 uncharacterized protein LOC131160447 [Malania oleifera]XP_057972124.1 uncharacterized protein LOC131160447 [Malania oleifera]XP_057972125.1 uncharacterized protein LOC131160447 [Malania oleifera]XP_057972126.1 uncharacterized protein LOC131160447 [Malania oleifera]XP_057972127.1 unc